MKRTRKIRYYKDKDKVERAIKGNRLMSKRDIARILDLYSPPNNLKPTQIYHKSFVKYRYSRLKLLISKYDRLKLLSRGDLPQNYMNMLFYSMNKKHLEKDETNKFIIHQMQKWLW